LNARDEVVLLAPEGDDWEVDLIRGALWYVGVSARYGRRGCDPTEGNRLSIAIPRYQADGRLSRPQPVSGTVVLVGRAVTTEYRLGAASAAGNEILIYGEPYGLLQELAVNEDLVLRSRGLALHGPLFDVRRYRSPRLPAGADKMSILTSLGCRKKCGYCSHGSNGRFFYGECFQRRPRPGADLLDEMAAGVAAGIRHFVMVADQFLSLDPAENTALFDLTAAWRKEEWGTPVVEFTTSPAEVLSNRQLLAALSCSFRLLPRLSIDNFDARACALLDLEFDTASALASVQVLASLRLPIRVNYLFVRPGATIEGLRHEFSCFEALAEMTSYMGPLERLFLAYDLFTGRLRLTPGAPVCSNPAVHSGYWDALPAVQDRVLNRILAFLNAQLAQCSAQEREGLSRAVAPGRGPDSLEAAIQMGMHEIASKPDKPGPR
jgi:hypothetical protein